MRASRHLPSGQNASRAFAPNWLRHGLQELRERGIDVSPHGEARVCDLLEPHFRKLDVAVHDLRGLERFVLENELIRCRQRSSNALVTDSAYEQLDVSEVPVHAFHITLVKCRDSILAEGVKPASELKAHGDRRHAYFHATRDAATAHIASKHGRRTMLCVQLRAAAEAGAAVLRTTQGCLLVTEPGVEARFVLNELPPTVIHAEIAADEATRRTTVSELPIPNLTTKVTCGCGGCFETGWCDITGAQRLFCQQCGIPWTPAPMPQSGAPGSGSHALCKFGVSCAEDIKFLAMDANDSISMEIHCEWTAASGVGCFDDLAAARFLHASAGLLPPAVELVTTPAKRRAHAPKAAAISATVDSEKRTAAALA